MNETWAVVVVVGLVTVLFKASGPAVLGGRALPPRLRSVVDLLAPVMLAALVVTQTFSGADGLALDARIAGVGAAAVALRLGVSLIPSMVVAAVVTAVLRAFF